MTMRFDSVLCGIPGGHHHAYIFDDLEKLLDVLIEHDAEVHPDQAFRELPPSRIAAIYRQAVAIHNAK